jgi:hypothetical protein
MDAAGEGAAGDWAPRYDGMRNGARRASVARRIGMRYRIASFP